MRRSVLPRHYGALVDVEAERLRHHDIARMTQRELWAEARAAEAELAERVARREPDGVVGWLDDVPVSAEAWLTERIARCRARKGEAA